MMPFVVFAAPFSSPEFYFHLPAHYNFPALHCLISLLSRNASWNTTGYGVWSWWWGKQILHHHMELLLLCRAFCLLLLYCRCCNKYVCCRYFVSVQYLNLRDAADSTFFLTAIILLKLHYVMHEWEWLLFYSAYLFIIVPIPSPAKSFAPHLDLFFISFFLPHHYY